MKDERNVRRGRAAGSRWQPVAILLAAVLMVLSVPFGLRPAYAVNLNEDCSLTVIPGNSIIAEDLVASNVVIDLYRVADATPVSGFDTYDWTMTEPFDSITIDKDIDSEGWKTAAQQAADIVLGTAPDGETEWKPESANAIDASLKVTGKKAGEKIEGLKAGLYLIVAHGTDGNGKNDPENYAAVTTDKTGAVSGTVTIANSHTYRYEFNPELVSLPTKDAIKDADGNDVINTGNPGDWVYDTTVTLKPSQMVRKGSLEITKTLIDYAQREKEVGNARIIKDPATFIFEVTAYEKKDSDTVIFHDFVSIVFDSYGSKSVLIKDLPVDSYVKVREVYSSEVYSLEETIVKDQTILADQNVGVEFENEFEEKNPGGGSVTNRFSYTEKDGWEKSAQVADDTEESIQDPIKPLNSKAKNANDKKQ